MWEEGREETFAYLLSTYSVPGPPVGQHHDSYFINNKTQRVIELRFKHIFLSTFYYWTLSKKFKISLLWLPKLKKANYDIIGRMSLT